MECVVVLKILIIIFFLKLLGVENKHDVNNTILFWDILHHRVNSHYASIPSFFFAISLVVFMMERKKIKVSHASLHDIVRERNIRIEDILAFLERDKSSINEKNQRGETPLFSVLRMVNCSVNVVKILLEYGADVNLIVRFGCPLEIEEKRRSAEAVLRAVLNAPGFSLNKEAVSLNYTPLTVAIEHKCSPSIIKILLQYGANVNCKGIIGRSALTYALHCENEEAVIRELLETNGFHFINEVDVFGSTPLTEGLEKQCSDSVVKMLLQYGANGNLRDLCGRSPLSYALMHRRNESVVRALLTAPGFSSINEVDEFHMSPLLLAIQERCPANIVNMLMQFGANISYRCDILFYQALKYPRDPATIKLLIKYCYLKIQNFHVLNWIPVCDEGYRERLASFGAECAREVQEIASVGFSRDRTLLNIVSEESSPEGSATDQNAELKNILNQLLERRMDIVCPIYFNMILVKVEKQLVPKLQEVVFTTVKKFHSVLGLGKILLNYTCACGVAEHLSNEEVFRLILTYLNTK